MTKLNLIAGKLYILSGIPGSGKTTFIQNSIKNGNVLPEMVLSTDKLREELTGKLFSFKGGKVKKRLYQGTNETVFEIIEKMLVEKLKEKLTVFLDATFISDKERRHYVQLAEKHGIQAEILIFDIPVETVIEQDSQREISVGIEVIDKFKERFQRDSEFSFKTVNSNMFVELTPNTINSEKIDIIGDVHGLYDQFIDLISSMGYEVKDNTPYHKEDRKLLFLGDIIDRGPDSVKMLKFAMNAVKNGHYMVMGNHEMKLLNNLLKEDHSAVSGSYAVTKTYLEVIREIKNVKPVIEFLKSLPGYYILNNQFVCCHANIGYFDFRTTPFKELIYGSYRGNVDSDLEYQRLFDSSVNQLTLIRGHILETSRQNNVFSLEMDNCFNGYLAGLPLDQFLDKASKGGYREAFDSSVVKVATGFDFQEEKKKSMLVQFRQLEKEKLARSKPDSSGLLRLYKYDKSVFFKSLWDKGGKPLLKARGIVLDISGRIVVHPFDKIFNYKENGTGENLDPNQKVQYIQKLNGFLGNISINPFTKELLVTTTGSFDSDFVGYIKDFIDRELEIKLKRFFAKNKVTLSFEVIHPEDPHIIKYPDDMFGLHLIGVRGLNPSDQNWSEAEVDNVAKELGFRRPYHGFDTFGNVLNKAKTLKDEGFMVRDSKGENFILKLKTPYYLTNKFIGRMGKGNIKFMFSNPNKFKEKIGDEEFFQLVDIVVNKFTMEEFMSMTPEDRVSHLREISDSLLS